MDDGVCWWIKGYFVGTCLRDQRGRKKWCSANNGQEAPLTEVTNRISAWNVGEFAGGEREKISRRAICLCLMRRWRVLSCLHRCNILDFHNFSGMNEAHFANNNEGNFAAL
ncbi:hypothetical protein ACNKHV_26485 [Shigella flexneri]